MKDIEYIIKKLFFSEKYLLKKRLIRAFNKKYEEELLVIDKFTDKSTDSVDIGVYRGVYSYQLAKHSRHVHGFEPNPLLFPYLKKNLNKIISNLTLYNCALSSDEGKTTLRIPKRSKSLIKNNIEQLYKLGASTIHKENILNDQFDSYEVERRKLDNILINKKIGFIKIDVEGHEKNVLQGSVEIIKKNKPVLLVEIEKKHTGTKVEETINYINSLGYKSYFLSGKNLEKTEKLINFQEKNNYFFLK